MMFVLGEIIVNIAIYGVGKISLLFDAARGNIPKSGNVRDIREKRGKVFMKKKVICLLMKYK